MPERPPVDIVGKPEGKANGFLVGLFMILGAVLICAAMWFVSVNVQQWRWASRYAAGMAEMDSRNAESLSRLCQTFMSKDILPHLGEENIRGWSDICFREGSHIAKYVK